MNLVEELLESILKGLVFSALVEFAHEMSAGAEGVVAESQGSIAEILPSRKKRPLLQPVYTFKMMRRRRRREKMIERKRKRRGKRKERVGATKTYHAASVIAKGGAARVHHPEIWVTNAPDPVAGRLLPGC